jgi:chromosome segregation protein
MRLKRLEIAGFKSIRDKIVLDFSLNISAIVGPNGCGKSNITDAIRWVMGEQRVKVLRGKKMDDVIFGGSEGAAPVGMAEVSMTLSNEERDFPAQYAEFSEVMVSRKLFRDGESEYAINKAPCRLMDVREFFMDTGVGARSYSFIEQNSISTLIEAGPDERRQFIEEAAGISKYKSRKDAAVRKMEATKQNLTRLQDITREVKSQLNALSRQAKRAEEYRDLKKHVREAELTLALQTFSELYEKQQALGDTIRSLKSDEILTGAKLEEAEAALEALKSELLDDEKTISEKQEKLYAVKNSINIKEQGVEFIKGRLADMASRKQKNTEEIDGLKSRLTNAGSEVDTLKSATDQEDEKIAELITAVAENQKQVDRAKQDDLTLQRDLDLKKNKYIEMVTQKSHLKTMMSQWEKQTDEIKRRDDKDLQELDDHEKKMQKILAQLDDLKGQLVADQAMWNQLSERKRVLSAEIEGLDDESRSVEENIQEIKEEVGKKSARLSSLKEFHEGYKWCNEGTKTIMSLTKKAGGDHINGNGFVGLVADFIDVPREYEMAVEAVLGEKLQYIVVKSQEDGADAIDYLRVHALGRGSFVPFEVRHALKDSHVYDHLRETDRLIEKVNIHDEYRGIVEYLLGDVLLIKNLKHGIALWRQNGFIGTFVTPEGDIINPSGVLTGGSHGGGEKSLLRNKREIAEMEEAVVRLGGHLRERTARKVELASLLADREEDLRDCVSENHELELQMNGRKKDCERHDGERNLIEQRIKIITFNRDNLKYEQGDIAGKIERAKAECRSFEQQEQQLNEDMTTLQEQWRALRKTLDEAERSLTAGKVVLASLEEKKKARASALDRLEASRVAMERELADKIREMETFGRDTDGLTRQMSEDGAALESLYMELDGVEAVLGEKKATFQERHNSLTALEARTREVRKQLDNKLKEINALELDQREVSVQADHLNDGMRTKYNVDLDILVKAFERLDAAAADDLFARLKKSRDYVENFGEVNLMALDEYEQIKERHDFLTEQLNDVNASLNSLQRTIARINKISRERFLEAFNAVNEYFQEVFARVFRGGKGHLRLTDETDLLETGVEIDIQIAGKKTQNISLLSGGEKSLAAIALVFAIILHRPSPFLVLDEVDAALDDANVSLFNDLIKDIAGKSQILMVTHNKKAMEAADHLFGVTMQKDGITTLVSVNLN